MVMVTIILNSHKIVKEESPEKLVSNNVNVHVVENCNTIFEQCFHFNTYRLYINGIYIIIINDLYNVLPFLFVVQTIHSFS